jgi:ribonuclease HI
LDRNKFIFEDIPPYMKRIFYLVLGVARSMGNPKKVPKARRMSTVFLVDKELAWFEGASQQNDTLCGTGGVIKIDVHTKYRWNLNSGRGTNMRDELLGAWESLFLAAILLVHDLFMVGDSNIFIDWLNGKGSIMVENLHNWMERISDIIPLFSSLTFAHIYREENKVANSLSKKALYLCQGQVTFILWKDGHEGLTHSLNLY